MTGNPTTQTFTVKMPFNVPTYILGIDVPWLMNMALPSSVLNTAISDVLTLEKFAGYNVQSVAVSGATFYGVSGHLELDYVLTTVSDPINAGEILVIIGAVLLAIAASILTAVTLGIMAPSAVAAWILVGTLIAGTFSVVAGGVSVVQTGGGVGGLLVGSSNQALGAVAVIIGLGVAGLLGYMYLKEPKRRAKAHRYVSRTTSKAKSAAKSAARRLR